MEAMTMTKTTTVTCQAMVSCDSKDATMFYFRSPLRPCGIEMVNGACRCHGNPDDGERRPSDEF
jgi:hypothetical protein